MECGRDLESQFDIPACAKHSARPRKKSQPEGDFMELVRNLWRDESGQDIAEYAVMLAVILVIVVGTVRLIGSNANTVFSSVASSIQ
jgi:Flp pilus assembly pilin Flp